MKLASCISRLCGAAGMVLWALSSLVLADQQPGVPASQGRLRIEGEAVERCVLSSMQGELTEITPRPNPETSLSPGTYWVQEIELTGGFSGYPRWLEDTLEVVAGETAVLQVGLPLTQRVSVERSGRVLAISYSLVDAQGRNYAQRSLTSAPPTFTVTKDGVALGGGTFEYG